MFTIGGWLRTITRCPDGRSFGQETMSLVRKRRNASANRTNA
jgi:hypothetical protein